MSDIIIKVDHLDKYDIEVHNKYINSIGYLIKQFESNMRYAIIDAINNNIYNNIPHYVYKFNFDDKALLEIKILDKYKQTIVINIINQIVFELNDAGYNIDNDGKNIYIKSVPRPHIDNNTTIH